MPLAHPDQLALGVLAESLADLGTRLFVRIREQLGLAYFVSATRFLGLASGYFCFYAGTDPKKKTLVEAAMLEEIAKLARPSTYLTAPEFEARPRQAPLRGEDRFPEPQLHRGPGRRPTSSSAWATITPRSAAAASPR